jgi:hypothetical protein
MTMRERPILFTGPMVRTILAGTKTKTRRVVKPRKDRGTGCPLAACELAGEINAGRFENSAYGQPGDCLWVREAWRTDKIVDGLPPRDLDPHAIWYDADGVSPDMAVAAGKSRRAFHLPRWGSRILLGVTGVHVERLQEISEEDAHWEGVDNKLCAEAVGKSPLKMGVCTQIGFAYLWDKINGAGSWDANPWVWVAEFKRIQP